MDNREGLVSLILPESKIDSSQLLMNNTLELNGSELKLSATTGDRVLIYRAVE
jgi:hypothetical protein